MSKPPAPLVAQFLDVGQGDAAVIFLPNSRRAIVVDAYDGNRVATALNQRHVNEAIVFFTHSDEDHVEGAADLFLNMKARVVALFYNHDRMDSRKGSGYQRYLRALAKVTRTPARRQIWSDAFTTNLPHDSRFPSLVSPPVSLNVLHPSHSDLSGLAGVSINDASGVLRVVYKPPNKTARAMLFTGDLQLTGISLLTERHNPTRIRSNVLKFPHHGSWPKKHGGITAFDNLQKKTLTDFVSAVNPELVILSVGYDNDDGHVHPDVFTMLRGATGTTRRLARIACTQFSPACIPATSPLARPACAGDVTVTFEPTRTSADPDLATHALHIRSQIAAGVAGCDHLLPTPGPPSPPPSGGTTKAVSGKKRKK